MSVVLSLSRSDPRAASELVETLPAGEGKYNAIDIIVFHWGNKDIDAATEWVEGLNDEQDRNVALEQLQKIR